METRYCLDLARSYLVLVSGVEKVSVKGSSGRNALCRSADGVQSDKPLLDASADTSCSPVAILKGLNLITLAVGAVYLKGCLM